MAKKTQKERAQIYFERNSKVAELFGTSDGFLFEKPQHAFSHSTTQENKEVKVYKANGDNKTLEAKDTLSDEPKFLKQSVKDMEAALPNLKDVDALKGYLEFEKGKTQPRSTAVTALEARIETLTNPE